MTIIYTELEKKCLDAFCINSSEVKYEKLNPSKTASKYINKHYDELKDILNFMKTYCTDFNKNTSLVEMLFRIKHHMQDRPVCKTCGGYVEFTSFNFGYKNFCSHSCKTLNIEVKEKFKNSILQNDRYIAYKDSLIDFKNINNEADEYIIRQYIKYNSRWNSPMIDGNKLFESTRWCQKHSDVINYIKNRFEDAVTIEENVYRLYNHMQHRPVCKTCGGYVEFTSFRFGYKNFCSHSCKTLNPEVKEKTEITNLNKYGCKYASSSKIVREKMRKTYTKHLQDAEYEFANTNNPESKMTDPERVIYNILCGLYTKDNVKPFHRDDRYRNFKNNKVWECDFYVKSIDTFIEYNGFPTHGNHPYNKYNKEDLLQKKILKNQQIQLNIKNGFPKNHSNYYKDCIEVWCKIDVFKAKIAKDNNLNYVTLYEKI